MSISLQRLWPLNRYCAHAVLDLNFCSVGLAKLLEMFQNAMTGPNRFSASGTYRFAISRTLQIIWSPTMIASSRELNSAPMNCAVTPLGGGNLMNCRNPFSPKIRNSRPRRMPATVDVGFIRVLLPISEQLLEVQECCHLNPEDFHIVSSGDSLPNFEILRRMVKKRRGVGGGGRLKIPQIYDRFRIPAQNADDSPNHHGTKSLFLVSTGSFLLNHPLTNIWGAIHYQNALRLALIQKANSIDVDNVN